MGKRWKTDADEGPAAAALVNGGNTRTKIMDTSWKTRLSKACLSFVIPRTILGAPPGGGTPCLTRQIHTNPALGKEPVAAFVVKWAIETTPLVSSPEGTRMRLCRHERTLRVVVSGSRWSLPHCDW